MIRESRISFPSRSRRAACSTVLVGLLSCVLPAFSQPPASPLDLDLAEAEGFLAIGNTLRARALGRIAFLRDPGDARSLVILARCALREGSEEEADLYLVEASSRGFVPVEGTVEKERIERLAKGEGEEKGVRIVARGLAFAEGVGPSRELSIDAGGAFDARAILCLGLDPGGRRKTIDPRLVPSTNLRIERDAENAVTLVRACESASTAEWIDVLDGKSGTRTRLKVVVAGPVETVRLGAIFDGAGRVSAAPGSILPVHVSLLDREGTRLYRPRVEWLAREGAVDASLLLDDTTSRRPPSHFFEPHRVLLRVPEKGTQIVVVARDPGSGVEGRLTVISEAGIGSERLPIPLDIFEGSFDEAVSRGRRDARPVLILAAAFW